MREPGPGPAGPGPGQYTMSQTLSGNKMKLGEVDGFWGDEAA